MAQIGILLFFVLAWAWGSAVLKRLPLRLGDGHRWIWALPLGIEALTLAAFLLSWGTGSVAWGVALTLISAGALLFLWSSPPDTPHLRSRWPRRWGPLLAVLAPWFAFTAVVYPSFLFLRDGALMSSWPTVWADWASHLRTSTFLAAQEPFTLENSLASGIPARYPLASAFLASVFQRAGLDEAGALLWSGAPFFALFPALVYSFLRGLGLRGRFALAGTAVFVFSGGLGILSLVQDLWAGKAVWDFDLYHPRLYTDIRDASGAHTPSGIWFLNVVIGELAPQRTFLFGLPWALITLLGLWQRFVQRWSREHRPAEALGWGAAWAALLLLHTHSALALGLVVMAAAACAVFREARAGVPIRWVPAAMLAGTAGGLGALVFSVFLGSSGSGGWGHPIAGWLPGPADLGTTLWFLINNLGVVLAASLAALCFPGFRVRVLALGSLVLLLAANLYSFQPWVWDNLKLLTWWYLLGTAAALLGLQRLWSPLAGGLWPKVLRGAAASGVLALAVGAGFSDVAVLGLASQKEGLGLASREGLEFAAEVKGFLSEQGREKAVVAIAPDHNHPVSLVSGARIYLGYTGWLWSYGISTADRENRLRQMYSGGPAGIRAAREEEIAYLVYGPPETARFQPDRTVLESQLNAVVSVGGWTLFEVPLAPLP